MLSFCYPHTSYISGRGRFRERGERERDTRRPGMNNRSQTLKPSPKTTKKNSAPQAPPPPPTSTTPTPHGDLKNPPVPTNNESSTGATSSSSNSNASGVSNASKTEKLSYAQMAQKKATMPPPLPKATATAAANQVNSVATTTGSQATTTPPVNVSGSSVSGGPSGSQQMCKTASAPTSPQGQQLQQQTQLSSGVVPNGGVPLPSGGGSKQQSNSLKTGKSGLSGSSGQLSAPAHPALTASKSAPASPQKEKLGEAVKSS